VLEDIRKSSEKFSTGKSVYRGVSQASKGKWRFQARVVRGGKQVKKIFDTELQAARGYDRIQIKHRGR
jgi:hypothetical protein